jgi:hypothetical protein
MPGWGRRASGRVLALDGGTSSVQALLFDLEGRPLPGAMAQIAYRPRVDAERAAEVDAEQLIQLTCRVVDALERERVALAGTPVRAVATSTFWHSRLAADAPRRPLTPLYLWADKPELAPGRAASGHGRRRGGPSPDRVPHPPELLAGQAGLAQSDAPRSLEPAGPL